MEGKKYDLEDRTLEFSKRILKMVKALSADDINKHYTNQIIRSSSSVGANYREANDALGKKDFEHRVKISRKESKETSFWIELIMEHNPRMKSRMQDILKESIELTKILSSIITKSKNKSY